MIDTNLLADNFVDGEYLSRGDREVIAHVNPTTGKQQGEVSIASAEDVDAAVAAARRAQTGWAATPGNVRRNLLLALADTIEARADELADIGVRENGTPRDFGAYVYGGAPADWFRYYAGWADKLEGRTIPTTAVHALDYTVHEPYGVVAVLTAFNAPMSFLGMKAAAALAAGNTVVLKPSELAPFSTAKFGELCNAAGIPPGVVNVVTGDGRSGSALARHPDVDKVTFTGGAPTAKFILQDLADLIRPVTLELGGKSAAILFDDADIDATVASVVQNGVAMLAGQACVAPTRLLVQQSIYPAVLDGLTAAAESVPIGDPSESGTVMGPLITAHHRDRVLGVIDTAQAKGMGRLLTGGRRAGGSLADGWFIEPTVFVDVDPASSLAQEEVFGPVLSVLPFRDEDEAVRLANSTRYGLAGYVYTEDLRRAHRVTARVQAGYLSINSFNTFPPGAPFGGYGQSGMGREGGQEGLWEMARTKNVHVPFD